MLVWADRMRHDNEYSRNEHKLRTFILDQLRSLFGSERMPARILPIWMLKLIDVLISAPMGDRYHGQRASEYNQIRRAQEWWQLEDQAMGHILGELEDCRTVLDIPCGTGRFFPLYIEFGLETTGLDLSPSMLEQCWSENSENSGRISLVQGSATDIPFGDNSFDLVVSFRFLQSIVSFSDAQKAIREMVRVAAKYVVLELDFLPHGLTRRFMPSGAATMRNRLTKDEILDLLGSSGLEVASIHGPFKQNPPSQFAFVCRKESLGN